MLTVMFLILCEENGMVPLFHSMVSLRKTHAAILIMKSMLTNLNRGTSYKFTRLVLKILRTME